MTGPPVVARSSPGFTLVEALVVLVCVSVALHLVMKTQLVMAETLRHQRERASLLAATRSARFVVREETTPLARSDWSVPSGDSFALRAVRGVGYGCGASEGGGFRYDGVRAPAGGRDSVLVLTDAGAWTTARLVSVHGGPDCVAWSLDPPRSDGLVVLPFERGSYHLRSGALRYRVGRGGRQPLTETVLEGFRLTLRNGNPAVLR